MNAGLTVLGLPRLGPRGGSDISAEAKPYMADTEAIEPGNDH